jgi:hypothetical protein
MDTTHAAATSCAGARVLCSCCARSDGSATAKWPTAALAVSVDCDRGGWRIFMCVFAAFCSLCRINFAIGATWIVISLRCFRDGGVAASIDCDGYGIINSSSGLLSSHVNWMCRMRRASVTCDFSIVCCRSYSMEPQPRRRRSHGRQGRSACTSPSPKTENLNVIFCEGAVAAIRLLVKQRRRPLQHGAQP